MHVESLTKLLLTDDELEALFDVCESAIANNLLSDFPLAFAMAIVHTFGEDDEITVDELNADDEITIH